MSSHNNERVKWTSTCLTYRWAAIERSWKDYMHGQLTWLNNKHSSTIPYTRYLEDLPWASPYRPAVKFHFKNVSSNNTTKSIRKCDVILAARPLLKHEASLPMRREGIRKRTSGSPTCLSRRNLNSLTQSILIYFIFSHCSQDGGVTVTICDSYSQANFSEGERENLKNQFIVYFYTLLSFCL